MENPSRNYPLEDIDRETMFHPVTSIADHLQKGPHIVSEARGIRLKDHKKRDLIDCGAGLWCVNIGYGRTEMAEAAKTAVEKLAYYHIFGGASNEPGGQGQSRQRPGVTMRPAPSCSRNHAPASQPSLRNG